MPYDSKELCVLHPQGIGMSLSLSLWRPAEGATACHRRAYEGCKGEAYEDMVFLSFHHICGMLLQPTKLHIIFGKAMPRPTFSENSRQKNRLSRPHFSAMLCGFITSITFLPRLAACLMRL